MYGRLDTTKPHHVAMRDGTERRMMFDELVTPTVGQIVVVRSFGRLRLGHIVELKRSRVVVERPENKHGAIGTRAYPREDVYVPAPETSDGRAILAASRWNSYA